VRESCREMDDFELDEGWVRAGGVDADAELEVDDSALTSPRRLDLSIAGIGRHRREFRRLMCPLIGSCSDLRGERPIHSHLSDPSSCSCSRYHSRCPDRRGS
jgi:hypothetical protein